MTSKFTPPSVYNAEVVLEMVTKMHNDNDVTVKKESSDYLRNFLNSASAWEVSDQILQRKKAGNNSTYFAAQTLRTKILYNLNELPENARDSLKVSLLQHLERLHVVSPIVRTQLSLAVCNLALQMPTWSVPAISFIEAYGGNSRFTNCLLELLLLLAEEIDNPKLKLGANRRSVVKEEMKSCATVIARLLNSYIETGLGSNVKTMLKIIQCISGYFRLQVFPCVDQTAAGLLEAPFHVLKHGSGDSLYEEASLCLCEAIYSASLEGKVHRELLVSIFNRVHDLQVVYTDACTREDINKCVGLSNVFSELACALINYMVCPVDDVLCDLKSLDLLLLCNAASDHEVSQNNFSTWHRLAVTLRQSDESLKDMFRPFFARLIPLLVKQCQLESESDEVLDNEDDAFYFRSAAAELACDIAEITGATNCFVDLFNKLSSLAAPTSDVTEAFMFVMSKISTQVNCKETVATSQVIKAVLSMPEDAHMMLKHTSITLIGGLSNWISAHSESLEHILPFVNQALHVKELSSTAAATLQRFCEDVESCKRMTAHHSSLVHLVSISDELNVSDEATIKLLKGVTSVVKLLGSAQSRECVSSLCLLQAEALQKDIESLGSRNPVRTLDRLAAVFGGLQDDESEGLQLICRDAFMQMWPLLNTALDTYLQSLDTAERWSRCIKYAIKSLKKQNDDEILKVVGHAITEAYRSTQNSCFLYLASILVDAYRNDPVLLAMFDAFLGPLGQQLGEENALQRNPDTIEDMFYLCQKLLDINPLEFIAHTAFSSLLECAIKCLENYHRRAYAVVLVFLLTVVVQFRSVIQSEDVAVRSKSTVQQALEKFGYQLVDKSLNACLSRRIAGHLTSDISSLWLEIIRLNREAFAAWLMQSLESLQESKKELVTEGQVAEFYKKVTDTSKHKVIVREIRDFSRLFN